MKKIGTELISIIVTNYNKEKYIERCLNSIVNQTYKKFEVIIIDDDSTDKSYSIISKFITDKRFKYIKTNKIGNSFAKNFGAKLCKRNFITFLDSDDFWEKNFLKEVSNLIKKYPSAGAYITGYRRIYNKGLDKVKYSNKKKTGIIFDYFKRRLDPDSWGIHTSSIVFRKNKFDNTDGFPSLIFSNTKKEFLMIDKNFKKLFDLKFENFNIYENPKKSRNIKKCDKYLKFNLKRYLNYKVLFVLSGEDQYLHDKFFLENKIAFSNKILSNWDGTISNQSTKYFREKKFLPHLLMLTKKIEKNKKLLRNKSLLHYIYYIIVSSGSKINQQFYLNYNLNNFIVSYKVFYKKIILFKYKYKFSRLKHRYLSFLNV